MGMGREELAFDEGDSYFLPMPTEPDGSPAPAPAHDSDTDSDTGAPLEYSPDLDNDNDNDAPTTATARNIAAAQKTQKAKRKQHPLSRHGHPLPPFPRATIKKMAQTFAGGASIGGEALEALVKASDAFWEQVAGDLAVYAGHAGRRTIEEGDVVVLMGRQRQITEGSTLFSLAQRHLPRELLQQVRMPVVKGARGGKRKAAGKGKGRGKGKAVEVEVEVEAEENGET
ncbi:hypothetical protein P167DRAFT_527236 [Morchella conica CCBAS932]|uniref:CENP-T/Histone H4 histone fold domain-containing protein n=1 Tax=Morchella conica CCBAS932 TaxID=1392247 RepID=A0A3N4KFV2_9PEZI|nr:hypothetical protein P167DRAFT_527236 [Morchella conica CCBAS932]